MDVDKNLMGKKSAEEIDGLRGAVATALKNSASQRQEYPSNDSDLPYKLGMWGGHTQYQCKLCAWDCLDDEGTYWDHWNARHKPLPPVKHESGILVADKRGNPV